MDLKLLSRDDLKEVVAHLRKEKYSSYNLKEFDDLPPGSIEAICTAMLKGDWTYVELLLRSAKYARHRFYCSKVLVELRALTTPTLKALATSRFTIESYGVETTNKMFLTLNALRSQRFCNYCLHGKIPEAVKVLEDSWLP